MSDLVTTIGKSTICTSSLSDDNFIKRVTAYILKNNLSYEEEWSEVLKVRKDYKLKQNLEAYKFDGENGTIEKLVETFPDDMKNKFYNELMLSLVSICAPFVNDFFTTHPSLARQEFTQTKLMPRIACKRVVAQALLNLKPQLDPGKFSDYNNNRYIVKKDLDEYEYDAILNSYFVFNIGDEQIPEKPFSNYENAEKFLDTIVSDKVVFNNIKGYLEGCDKIYFPLSINRTTNTSYKELFGFSSNMEKMFAKESELMTKLYEIITNACIASVFNKKDKVTLDLVIMNISMKYKELLPIAIGTTPNEYRMFEVYKRPYGSRILKLETINTDSIAKATNLVKGVFEK